MGTPNEERVGVLAALAEELGPLRERAAVRREVHGLELLEIEGDGGPPLLACAGGVGKVRAARAATVLVHAAPALFGGARLRALLVVGVAGGVAGRLKPGELVHCVRAVQTDFAVRADREHRSDERLRQGWLCAAPGREGWFLTADRPVFSPWRRLRLARAFAGVAVADMETAAAAAVAELAGLPWAALRAVTDGAGLSGPAEFRRNFRGLAARAAETVPSLVAAAFAPGEPDEPDRRGGSGASGQPSGPPGSCEPGRPPE